MSNYQESAICVFKEWPYPVNYGKENEVSVDVLILGGGIAGCHAAINAAQRGAKVAVVDKGAVIRSGLGGSGVDHWHNALTNPCSTITPEEFMSIVDKYGDYSLFEYGNGMTCYITCKESWDALLDMERWGMKIRDVDDEFVGAEFRDEETKLMFAYDYKNKHVLRIMGEGGKPAMYKELKRLGVSIYDRVMATSLLTEGGKQGSRVVGATGVNTRTGEFYVFKAKATLLSAGVPSQLWVPSSASGPGFLDLNNSGDSTAMAWQAGAELTTLERSSPAMAGALSYPAMGTGMSSLTWFACTMVDDNGKEIPWVDRDGRVLKTVSERYQPSPGQRLFTQMTGVPYELQSPGLITDLRERIRMGEYVLPFYADLPSMPEYERRVIFGLMVGHEGKTRPIYERYTRDGFDPDKDMLQVYGGLGAVPGGGGPSRLREAGMSTGGGLVVDWDLKTTLEGLYAAGTQIPGGTDYSGAATTGRYAGRKMTAYAKQAAEPVVDRKQVDTEKARVYNPVKRQNGIGWKELHAGICQIMQEYCGENKSEKILNMGLNWLSDIRETEAAETCARNPHELCRTLECLSRITVGEAIMHASLARKASSQVLDFKRIDFPEIDPPEWNKFVTIRQQNGKVKVGELPFKYWLKSPNAATYEENYQKHCGL